MSSILDILQERGFIQQISDEPGIRDYLAKQGTSIYIGFDPTGDSLHVGHLIPIMALTHLQKAGHTPLAIVGGGTAMIGDPSGKTELRQMLTKEQIAANIVSIKKQLANYLDFDGGRAKLLNNGEWLCGCNYIDFLREIGRHFSVNRMLAAESYRMRLETGLNFIEFNYMILQAFDFLKLAQEEGCLLQMGGNDQWGNIVAGIDLIRRIEGKEAYALTFPLITTSSGAKMGKTASGAVWLSPERTTPYDYYQYWRNSEDADVGRFLALFTHLPMDEVKRLGALQGEESNEAKKILALEATAFTHGRAAAENAADWKGNMPEVSFARARLAAGIPVIDAFMESGLFASKSEVRRLIEQGGAYLNGEAVNGIGYTVTAADLAGGSAECRAGKKKYFRLVAGA